MGAILKKISFRRIDVSSPEPLRRFEDPACFVFASLEEVLDAYGVSRIDTRIDFEKNLVLAAHRGLCNTGGYGIAVSAVELSGVGRSGSEVDVRLNLKDPEPGAIVLMILTYPSVHVLIPRKAVVAVAGDSPAATLPEGSYPKRVAFNFSDPSGLIRCRVVRELGQ
ncbi:MAG: protease complex subunit PrcB family protein [Actinobacteria bacterium]|nr:protease complex subunit PrcB family protein [Actinomycetota bacterium]